MTKIECWFVDARTGCSCCSSENFQAGPFRTIEEARARANTYHATARLASQYAARGVYDIRGPVEGELLEDGRIIVGDHVYDTWGWERGAWLP